MNWIEPEYLFYLRVNFIFQIFYIFAYRNLFINNTVPQQ